MHYMYHSVPEPMVGSVLNPLNRLREIEPEAYAQQARKYAADKDRNRPDRRQLMESKIPKLNCLWNDVLFSSAVHPQTLMDAWIKAGYRSAFDLRMFEIPLDMLDAKRLLIYRYRVPFSRHLDFEFVRYDPKSYEKHTHVPYLARVQFRAMAKKKPFWRFVHIPHVLYQGEIESRGLTIIAVNPPK